jgi:hypothetical protein
MQRPLLEDTAIWTDARLTEANVQYAMLHEGLGVYKSVAWRSRIPSDLRCPAGFIVPIPFPSLNPSKSAGPRLDIAPFHNASATDSPPINRSRTDQKHYYEQLPYCTVRTPEEVAPRWQFEAPRWIAWETKPLGDLRIWDNELHKALAGPNHLDVADSRLMALIVGAFGLIALVLNTIAVFLGRLWIQIKISRRAGLT